MKRIQITTATEIISASTVDQLVSIDGGSCMLYTGAMPTDPTAGHYVSGGYQIVVPAGVNLFATVEPGGKAAAVVGDFGV